MPTVPSLAIVTCETCGKQLTADERMASDLFPWKRRLAIEPNGTCPECDGNSWTLTVIYAQKSTDIGSMMAGVGLEATIGFGITHSSTASNQMVYSNVPARILAELNEDPRSRMSRIGEFASSIERQRALDGGAKECITCGVLFTPVADKPWTLAGYCSKSCFVQSEGGSSNDATLGTSTAETRSRPLIQVRCEEGHQFDVQVSFRGMLRPCPRCGKKTRVPE